jgi:PX domain
MDKNSLLASLTGDLLKGGGVDGQNQNVEQDLFGGVSIDEEPPLAVNNHSALVGAFLPPKTDSQPASQPTPHSTSNGSAEMADPLGTTNSLLSKSGLIGASAVYGSVGDSGGLFDEIDEEVEKQKQAELRRRQEEEERKRQELETHRKQEEVAIKQQQEEQQRIQLQIQQQQQQHALNNGQPYQLTIPFQNVSSPLIPPYQQPSAMMQSALMTPQPLDGQMQRMTINGAPPDQTGFYREHNANMGTTSGSVNAGAGSMPPPSNAYGGGPGGVVGGVGYPPPNNYYYGTQHQQQQQQQQQYVQSNHQTMNINNGGMSQPSATVGMHNSMQNIHMGRVRKITLVKPQDVAPLYTGIRITEPMLIQTQSFLISSPPYWSYQIAARLAGNQGTWLVRRRFRHVVALEDRLRQMCPGSILPPRPEKHATRALEEASTLQSAEFAMQRAKELELYLNQLASHPVAGHSQVLRLFLGLQDDIGTAWPECSSNALTRLGAVGAGVSMKVAESTNLTAASAPAHEWEEDAELLSLCSSESLRLGAVSQAVPKLEGTVFLLRDLGDAAGALGMELSKASKTLDTDFKVFEVLSTGLLRNGRRTKRLALEMGAAMESFLQQYKLVRYEKMAMLDRRNAMQRKAKERGRADNRAFHLSQQQRQLQINGQMHHLSQLEQNAIQTDSQALDAVSEADEVGARLKSEIHRVAIARRTEWNRSMKTVASSMKEACSERVAIWEATLEAFENLTKLEEGHTGPMPQIKSA